MADFAVLGHDSEILSLIYASALLTLPYCLGVLPNVQSFSGEYPPAEPSII